MDVIDGLDVEVLSWSELLGTYQRVGSRFKKLYSKHHTHYYIIMFIVAIQCFKLVLIPLQVV